MIRGTPHKPIEPDIARALFQGTRNDAETSEAFALFNPFEDTAAEIAKSTGPIRPANMELLFDAFSASKRSACAQPRDYASVALGIRQEPSLRCRAEFGKIIHDAHNFEAHAGPGWVSILCSEGSSSALKRVHFDLKKGTVHEGIAASIDGAKGFAVVMSIATDDGVALSGGAPLGDEYLRFISLYDVKNLEHSWTTSGAKYAFERVDWLHAAPNGDVVAIYLGKDADGNPVCRICRLEKQTGAIVYDKACAWPSLLFNYVDSQPHLSRRAAGFHYDHPQQTVCIGACITDTQPQFFSININNGSMTSLGAMPGGENLRLLDNGRLVLGEKKLVTFDSEGIPTTQDYDLSEIINSTKRTHHKTSKTHGVAANSRKLSFFEITPTGWEPVETIRSTPEFSLYAINEKQFAVTQDNVAYVSVGRDDEELAHDRHCTLLAYDATTGELLWSYEAIFESLPEVLVNSDGSISWFDLESCLILEN